MFCFEFLVSDVCVIEYCDYDDLFSVGFGLVGLVGVLLLFVDLVYFMLVELC